MLHRRSIILAVSCVLISVVALGASGQVPDPSFTVKLYPDADKSGPPPVVKPGLRLVYFGGSSTIPGVREKLVPDENGNWVNKTTGRKYAASDVQGSGGVGYSVARIGHVDREVAQITSATYLMDTLNNTVSSTGASGLVSNAGAAGDYWVHPDVLKKIKPVNENGTFIGRMPYVVMNRKYNAIRFQTESQSGHTAYVYDLDTGIMIFHGSSAIGGDVVTPGVNGQAGVGRGSTFLSHGYLVEMKQVEVPWAAQPVPAWVGEFQQLRYDGGTTTAIQGAGQFNNGLSTTITVKARGNGWLRYVNDVATSYPNAPVQRGQVEGSAGNATISGLWISPGGLAALKTGQVIDSIDAIKTKTVVTDVGRGYVVISDIGQLHRLDCTYNATTGILTSVVFTKRDQLSVATTQLRLVGQK